MSDMDDYANGRHAGVYGGPVPDTSSSEAMRGYYDGVRYKESMEPKPESNYEPYQYTPSENTAASDHSVTSAVADGLQVFTQDIRKAKVRACEWSQVTRHGKIYAWIFNVLYITSKTMASFSFFPIVIGLLFHDNLITGIGGAMLLAGLFILLVFCLPAFLSIALIRFLHGRRK